MLHSCFAKIHARWSWGLAESHEGSEMWIDSEDFDG